MHRTESKFGSCPFAACTETGDTILAVAVDTELQEVQLCVFASKVGVDTQQLCSAYLKNSFDGSPVCYSESYAKDSCSKPRDAATANNRIVRVSQSSNTLTYVIVAVTIVALLAVAGGIGFFLWRKRQQNSRVITI